MKFVIHNYKMKNQFTIILSILLAIAVLSCNKKETNSAKKNVEIVDSLPNAAIEEVSDEQEESIPYEPNNTYPKTGNKITDFVPGNGLYEVQYQAEGDLNNDGLADIAVVLKYKENKISKRPMLLLLQNEDKSYRLDKVSNITMPVEYNDYDYKLYDTEDISIEKGELNINLYGGGASGTFLSQFKYIENNLVLNNMEIYFAGAGGRSGFFYDREKGEITSTETNTMREDEPTTSETSKVKKELYLFEETSITDVFN